VWWDDLLTGSKPPVAAAPEAATRALEDCWLSFDKAIARWRLHHCQRNTFRDKNLGTKSVQPSPASCPRNHKTPGHPGVLGEADEGIRTLDLRHGKATL
jgi:hypothetical protein